MAKRIKINGHYCIVERDEKGRFLSSKKWSSKLESTFETKLKIAERLQKKFPNDDIGFTHKGKHYVVIDGKITVETMD